MWEAGDAYHRFMGRWSAGVADEFVARLDVAAGGRWLDVGCGLGDVTSRALAIGGAGEVVGVDLSEQFVAAARDRWRDEPRLSFQVASAVGLPFDDDAFAAVVSGLALNFVPDVTGALAEMGRARRRPGPVGVYVWDYGAPDVFLTCFWASAEAVLGGRAGGDERGTWPVCTVDGLAAAARAAGLDRAEVATLQVPTAFASVDDLWDGFALGVGPAGVARSGWPTEVAEAVHDHLTATLPVGPDGSVPLTTTALTLVA